MRKIGSVEPGTNAGATGACAPVIHPGGVGWDQLHDQIGRGDAAVPLGWAFRPAESGSGGPGSGDPQQGVVDVGGALQHFQLGILFFGKVRADLLQIDFANLVQGLLCIRIFEVGGIIDSCQNVGFALLNVAQDCRICDFFFAKFKDFHCIPAFFVVAGIQS